MESIQAPCVERAVDNPCCCLLFGNGDVENEIAAIANLNNKYAEMLNFGFDPD